MNFSTDHKILVVGLGSMGKRRIRNLMNIGFSHIAGYDTRQDRIDEASRLHAMSIESDPSTALSAGKYSALIISVPPDAHHIYIDLAMKHNVPYFVEASVVDTGMAEVVERLKSNNLVAAPSATMYFHPAVKKIYELVNSGVLGDITNVSYHSGQYLPDWHTYEPVSDYYVSNPDTGGAREIVPFELTWLTKLFGFPRRVCGVVKKTIEIQGAEHIDDTYNALLDYDKLIINLVVDVVSRYATRKITINGSERQLTWSWDENEIKIFNPQTESFDKHTYELNSAAEGYNKNIAEQMYAEELINFFEAIEGHKPFFNSIEYDHRILKLLYSIEESSRSGKFVDIL